MATLIVMAGPVLLILTPERMSEAKRRDVETVVSALSDGITNSDGCQDFRVAGRPFFMWFGCDYTDDEVEPDFPADAPIGFAPAGQVGVAAMCNQTVDHLLLATLAGRLCTVLGGIIWLDGQWKREHDPTLQGVEGLISIGSHTHFASVEFINRWIESPHFRLPK